MGSRYIEKKIDGRVCILTISRPEALNAFNSEVLTQLQAVLAEVGTDDGIASVVITGSGDKAFVAGADIREMIDLSSMEAVEFARKGHQVMAAITNMSVPVIAAVNGFALGGGFELALACDFIYASENAKFGFPEASLGIMPGFGGTQNLPRLVGENVAKELIFTGKMIDAGKAKELGVVSEVLPANELLGKALETAKRIAANAGIGVAIAKKAIATGMNIPKEEALRHECSLFAILFSTEDQKEGMQAFVEKRKPNFKNA